MPLATRNSTINRCDVPLPFLLSLAAALLSSGCGDDAGGRRAVSGTVTLNGNPVVEGMIDFIPAAGPTKGSTYTKSGAVIKDGRYTIPKNQGLVPGQYKVSISAPDKHHKLGEDELPGPTSSRTSKNLIPPEFNLKSKLIVEVKKDGPNTINFAIP